MADGGYGKKKKGLVAPSYDLKDLLEAEEDAKFQSGDHVAILTNADDWDYGWRVSHMNDIEIVVKKADFYETISLADAPSKLRTDHSGAMIGYKELNNSERTEYREVFGLFDMNGDGSISADEILTVLDRLSPSLRSRARFTRMDIVNMIAMFDDSGDGEIDFDEFIKLMSGKLDGWKEVDELRECFNIFDATESGEISPYDLIKILKAVGEDITMDEIRAMLEDIDDSGQINFNEFKRIILEGP